MEAALPENSKVIVECTDPASLLSHVEPLLADRLPLRNLHWKSPNRPLRSIDTLNVSFTRTDDGQSNAAFGQRRHQIPGLRQTPYVKIFLFRCDDKDTYKESGRKQLKHWIKNHTPPPEGKKASSNQEYHDAFEWLIVHVVLPDTTAASEPRTSKHVSSSLGTTDSTDSVSSKSKWTGKSSSTIYEKLRADFSSSSKSHIDRVVQVRLSKTTQSKISPALAPAEIEEQWQDLVEKLKVTILASFDTRVAQYEDDIKERDGQRNLPGWNFCTFFALKEGLAKGFENVGLLEDAMIGYDELSAGLDAVAKEQAMRDEGDQGTLLPFSKEMKDKLRIALGQLRSEGDTGGELNENYSDDWLFQMDPKSLPFDPRRKNYQDLILGNDVSALDFRTYIFSRQLELLRRRSKAPIPSSRDSTDTDTPTRPLSMAGAGNLVMLAEIGSRGVNFITLAARAMRRDLYRAWGGQEGLTGQDLQTQRDVIDNIVGSWTWTAALQLLELTNTPALDLPDDFKSTTASLARNSVVMHRPVSGDEHSETQSQPEPSLASTIQSPDQDMFTLETYTGRATVFSIQSSQVLSQREPSKATKTGADQLALSRAEILLLARRVVERLGSKKGYIQAKYSSTFDDQSSEKKESNGNSLGTHTEMLLAGIDVPLLKRVAGSAEAFSRAYEMLTDFSCRHFVAANRFKSAERAVVDLALMKYRNEDYSTAAEYFGLVANFYGKSTWSSLTESVLEPYAACLKQLGRQEEYFRCVLAILTATTQGQLSKDDIDNEKLQGYLDDLWSLADSMDGPMNVSLLSLFELSDIDGCVQHFDDRDGFIVHLSIALRLNAKVRIANNVLLNLVAADEEGPPKKLTLKTPDNLDLSASRTTLRFESKVTAHGWFEFSTLEFDVGKVHFHLSMKDVRASSMTSSGGPRGLIRLRKPILLYPSSRSINIKALAHPFISLGQPRKINLQVSTNSNEIRDCKITTKAATAGLRLRVHETEIVTDEEDNTAKMVLDKDGDIRLSSTAPNAQVTLAIPYTLESTDNMLLITNLQVTYTTPEGTFVYYDSVTINTLLPISVNVQEIFRSTELLSRFTISPSTLVPLRLTGCGIDGGDQYDVEAGIEIKASWSVFPKQPASFVYRFIKKTGTQNSNKNDPLPLLVDYECIDEIILSAVEVRFSADISATQFVHLSHLLTSHLLLAYRTKWTEQDLEVALLTQEIEIWPFEEIGWEEILIGLQPSTLKELIPWLRSWHSQQKPISFDASKAPVRRISIPIEIPTPRIVITASLEASYTGPAVSVGQAVLATLKISFTDFWRDSSIVEGEVYDLSYDLVAPPEKWLLGGRRKGNFTCSPHEVHTFQILLLPQKVGHLMYPSLDIKCHVANKEDEVPCEVDYQSIAVSMLVIAGLKSTTLAIDGEKEGGVGGVFVVGSEKMDLGR